MSFADSQTNDDSKTKCHPLKRNKFKHNLDTSDVLQLFDKARTTYKDKISSEPPVLPLEGEVYLFSLGPDESKWDSMRQKFRLALIIC